MIAKSIAVALTVSLLAIPPMALADKEGNPGKGKNGNPGKGKHEISQDYRHDGNQGGKNKGGKGYDDRHDRDERRHDGGRVEFHFGDRDRTIVHDYYVGEIRGGHCPPGLAKKGNGCMPPGQAKKWVRGRPLPHDVIFYDLPHDLIIRLPPPPTGHRYVRVAGDILLIAIGSAMVVDAVQDIFR